MREDPQVGPLAGALLGAEVDRYSRYVVILIAAIPVNVPM